MKLVELTEQIAQRLSEGKPIAKGLARINFSTLAKILELPEGAMIADAYVDGDVLVLKIYDDKAHEWLPFVRELQEMPQVALPKLCGLTKVGEGPIQSVEWTDGQHPEPRPRGTEICDPAGAPECEAPPGAGAAARQPA